MTNHQENIEVVEQYPDHHYRTEIPNIIYELKLTPFEVTVYNILKRIAGDRGSCWRRAEDIAEIGQMSKREYDKCIKRLESKFDLIGMPLIKVEKRFKACGAQDTNKITILDIWRQNGNYFKTKFKKSLGGERDAGGGVHEMQGGGAPYAPKEDPSEEDPSLKNNPLLPLLKEQHLKEKDRTGRNFPSHEKNLKQVSEKIEDQQKLDLLNSIQIPERIRINRKNTLSRKDKMEILTFSLAKIQESINQYYLQVDEVECPYRMISEDLQGRWNRNTTRKNNNQQASKDNFDYRDIDPEILKSIEKRKNKNETK
jgi:hypothetical protein